KKQTSRPNTGGIEIPRKKKRTAFVKGFGVNGVNPFVLLFWISIASLVSLKTDWSSAQVLNYYAGILITVFSIDLLKAFVAKQLTPLMTPRLMWILNKSVGVVMVFFGLRMLWFAFIS
ncbi:MAG TPA: LysE family transporter, partial [Algoriphagus sp.]|nr:LysE family transporter [Algoriphagus sp.]